MLKIAENLWAVGAPPQTTLEELTALRQTPIAGGEGACCPSPRTPPLISAFGLDFRSYGPHSVRLGLAIVPLCRGTGGPLRRTQAPPGPFEFFLTCALRRKITVTLFYKLLVILPENDNKLLITNTEII